MEKTNEDTSDNDTDETIIYKTDELKKSNRKKIKTLRKRAKDMKVKKSRTAKIYTMNTERKNIKTKKRNNITKCKRQKTGRGIFPYSFKS